MKRKENDVQGDAGAELCRRCGELLEARCIGEVAGGWETAASCSDSGAVAPRSRSPFHPPPRSPKRH